MIAKPSTRFQDQGFLGWFASKMKLRIYDKQAFTMDVSWKDVKYHGEGTAICHGSFTNLENYYFSKIVVKVTSPRKEEYTILENNTIDV